MELDWRYNSIHSQKIKRYIILLPPIHNSIGGNNRVFRHSASLDLSKTYMCPDLIQNL